MHSRGNMTTKQTVEAAMNECSELAHDIAMGVDIMLDDSSTAVDVAEIQAVLILLRALHAVVCADWPL